MPRLHLIPLEIPVEDDRFPTEIVVESSRGGSFYTVSIVDSTYAYCECKGFYYTSFCKHLKIAYDTVNHFSTLE